MLQTARRPEDWGQREKHPLYGLWGWHKNRNRYGMVPTWAEDFWVFVQEVGERPSPDHRLRRYEIAQPLGPKNFFWDVKYAHGSNAANTLAQRAEYMREYRKRRPRNVRNTELKKHYGITLDDWESLHTAQNGVCAICQQTESTSSDRYANLAVDHCHTTGKVRGLLCNTCNRALGLFKDNPVVLAAALQYLNSRS